jgi:hypothetical protein
VHQVAGLVDMTGAAPDSTSYSASKTGSNSYVVRFPASTFPGDREPICLVMPLGGAFVVQAEGVNRTTGDSECDIVLSKAADFEFIASQRSP